MITIHLVNKTFEEHLETVKVEMEKLGNPL